MANSKAMPFIYEKLSVFGGSALCDTSQVYRATFN